MKTKSKKKKVQTSKLKLKALILQKAKEKEELEREQERFDLERKKLDDKRKRANERTRAANRARKRKKDAQALVVKETTTAMATFVPPEMILNNYITKANSFNYEDEYRKGMANSAKELIAALLNTYTDITAIESETDMSFPEKTFKSNKGKLVVNFDSMSEILLSVNTVQFTSSTENKELFERDLRRKFFVRLDLTWHHAASLEIALRVPANWDLGTSYLHDITELCGLIFERGTCEKKV